MLARCVALALIVSAAGAAADSASPSAAATVPSPADASATTGAAASAAAPGPADASATPAAAASATAPGPADASATPAEAASATAPSPADASATPAEAAAEQTPAGPPAWYTWTQHYLRFDASAAAGHDSNIIEVPGNTPTPSDKGGALTDYTAGASILVLDKSKVQAHVGVDGDLTIYPEYHRLAYMRTSAEAGVQAQDGNHQVGLLMGYDRFYLHYRFYSSSVHPDAYAAFHYGPNVTIVGGGFQSDYYVDNHPVSGNGGDVSLHQWRLLDGDVLSRRVELGLRAQRFTANDGVNSYSGITPSAAASWRLGDTRAVRGTIDIKATGALEFRQYDRPDGGIGERERQTIPTAGGSVDFWLCTNATLGAFILYTVRDSNVERDHYDRVQDGVRLSATW